MEQLDWVGRWLGDEDRCFLYPHQFRLWPKELNSIAACFELYNNPTKAYKENIMAAATEEYIYVESQIHSTFNKNFNWIRSLRQLYTNERNHFNKLIILQNVLFFNAATEFDDDESPNSWLTSMENVTQLERTVDGEYGRNRWLESNREFLPLPPLIAIALSN